MDNREVTLTVREQKRLFVITEVLAGRRSAAEAADKLGISLQQIGHGESLDADRIPAHYLDCYAGLQKYTGTMKNDGAMIGNVTAFCGGFSSVLTISDDLLRSAPIPTPFYCGTGEDALGGGETVVGPMAATMPNADLEMVEGDGHLPWLDAPLANEIAAIASPGLKANCAGTGGGFRVDTFGQTWIGTFLDWHPRNCYGTRGSWLMPVHWPWLARRQKQGQLQTNKNQETGF